MLVLFLLVGTAVGFVAYNMGVSHGLAISAQTADVERDARAAAHYYGYYGWHPWGFGFGFLAPLFFIAFWFFVVRFLFWGGPWRRYGYGPYRGWGPYDERTRDVPPRFEEWHRRAHERMSGEPSAPDQPNPHV